MSKLRLNQELFRKRVYAFIDLDSDADKKSIAKHFKMEGESKSTIYDIIKRKENGMQAERKVGSGHPAKKMTKKAVKGLVDSINQKDGVSQRALARRFEVCQQYISRVIQTKTTIRYWKKRRAPKRTSAQKAAIRPKCRKLASIFRKYRKIEVVAKTSNPANCPELRPIEDFWSELKRTVYDKCWVADNLDQLRNRIEYALKNAKKVSPERVQNLATSTFKRIDATHRRNGLKG